MDTTSIFLTILAMISIIGGIAGLVLPMLPGPLLLFIGLFLAAWSEDFIYVGTTTLIILALLMIVSHILDVIAGAFGAKKFGASRSAVFGAIIGAFIGIFFGLVGVFIGPFIGAVIGQLTVKNDWQTAGNAGIGAWIGLLLGTVTKMAIGITMIAIFIAVRFF